MQYALKCDKLWDIKNVSWKGKFSKENPILLRSGTALSLGVEVGVVIFPGGGVEAGAIRDFLGSVSLVLRHS